MVSSVALATSLVASPSLAQAASAQREAVSPQGAGGANVNTSPPSAAVADAASAEGEEILVTGFRASLTSALGQKRAETAAVDSILAEDIGKFPDSNLAESMQRIPGVALARGDGGEGRNISVRGLGAAFTRIRINGMEGTAQAGASDIYGASNNGRSFDFNVFPTEIFSGLSVRKTPSADVEEGSLGATIDLMAPKPLSQKEDFALAATGRGVYSEISKQLTPRLSLLVSKKFADGRFGILGSIAYQERDIREVGYSAVDLLSANTNGGFCSPIGFAPQNPGNSALKGTTATNCSTGNPRTSTTGAYQTIFNLRRDNAPTTPGSGAFLPRIPRYLNSEQQQKRIGGTLTFQFQPDDRTDIAVDLLYSRFDVTRRDSYMGAISFGRSASNNGQPMTSVRDAVFDENGSLTYGLFDGVDVRSEGLLDQFRSTFKQASLSFKRELSETLEVTGLVGINESRMVNSRRLQYFVDAIDTDNFSIDFRDGGSTPVLGFGIDVANPNNFQYAPGLADGTVLGGYSLQNKPQINNNGGMTGEVNFAWEAGDGIRLKMGGQYRRANFTIQAVRPYTADTIVKPLPAGVTVESLSEQITGVDKLWGNGAPPSWLTLDPYKFYDTLGLDSVRLCGAECGAINSRVLEEVTSAYVMTTFDLVPLLDVPIRGDIGVRFVSSNQLSTGNITVAAPAGVISPTGVVGQFARATNSYQDWLPSANIVIEPVEDLLIRLSGAKVLARPELGVLTPTSGVNPVTRTGNINNPFLQPIRANTFDVGVEWYFQPGALLSAAFFYKDIKTYVQNVTSLVPFNQLGLPDDLLIGSNTAPTELFNISQPFNTPGGPLKGVEVNLQLPFTFLGGFARNFGVLANYTHVVSSIEYILSSANGVPTSTTTADLIGLSKNTASGTLYYEDGRFSIRGTANYRDPFIRGIPASPGSDMVGNSSTVFIDASASFNVTDRFRLILEAQNLTDEQNRLYTDSVRQDTLFQTRVGRTISFGANYTF